MFNTPDGEVAHDGARHIKEMVGEKAFVTSKPAPDHDELLTEWDGEKDLGPELEGSRGTEERRGQSVLSAQRPGTDVKTVVWDPEPQLTADQ